jgi:hypothetical protein
MPAVLRTKQDRQSLFRHCQLLLLSPVTRSTRILIPSGSWLKLKPTSSELAKAPSSPAFPFITLACHVFSSSGAQFHNRSARNRVVRIESTICDRPPERSCTYTYRVKNDWFSMQVSMVALDRVQILIIRFSLRNGVMWN